MKRYILGISILIIMVALVTKFNNNITFSSIVDNQQQGAVDDRSFKVGILSGEFTQELSSMEMELYAQILEEFKKLDQFNEAEFVNHRTLRSLFDALENDNIDVAMTNMKYADEENYGKHSIRLQYSYGIYSEEKKTNHYLTKYEDGWLGYVEESVIDEINQYYNDLTLDGKKYESYDEMLREFKYDSVVLRNIFGRLGQIEKPNTHNSSQDESSEMPIKYLLMPYEGKVIYLDESTTLYLNYHLNDFALENHFYYREEDGRDLEFLQTFFSHDSEAFKLLANEYHVAVAREHFALSVERKPIQDVKAVGEVPDIRIAYNDLDYPLVVRENSNLRPEGVLPALFDMIREITGVGYTFVPVSMVSDPDQVDLFTKGACEYLEEKSGMFNFADKTELLFENSTLIVGEAGDSKFEHHNQLAMKSVGIVNGKSNSSDLKSRYDKIDIKSIDKPKEAVQDLVNQDIDYMILDEYSMLFLTNSELTNGLSVLGEWGNNSNVYLYSLNKRNPALALVNRAMNYIDGQVVLQDAIKEVVRNENDQPAILIYFAIIAVLVLIVIVSVFRGYQYRSDKKKLDYLATHDPLTKSMNLLGMKKQMMAAEGGATYKLLLVDVNQFKRVNNTHSYEFGNDVLIQLSKTMEEYVGNRGYVARYGSDEFAVALEMKSMDDMKACIEDLHQRLIRLLRSLIDYDLSLSIGVADLKDYSLLEDSYTNAENALNQQKEKRGSGIAYFTDKLGAQLELDKILSKDIARGFELEEFKLVYQPQFTKNGKEIVGSEALVRWHHPDRGVLAPGKFLHLIRKENAVKKLDYYVLEQACKQIVEWNRQGLTIPKVSVNITPITLCDYVFLKKIIELRSKHDFKDFQLCIEITEDAEMVETLDLEQLLLDIRKQGICVAIDDFGAGYSSLSYIVKYPADHVKLDKSLIDNIVIRKQDYDFLKGIINVLQGLGKIIIVEGVETIGQIEKLSCFNDLYIQGYCYSKPLSAERLIETVDQLMAGNLASD